jgi:hypothetical protein
MLIHGTFRGHHYEDLFGVFDGHGGAHVRYQRLEIRHKFDVVHR